jgi:peptide chain release factor subunit 1
MGFSKSKIVNKKKKLQTAKEIKSNPYEKCRSVEYEVAEKDIIDVSNDLALRTNSKVEVISTESEEKAKLTALGGFTALL